MVPDPGYISFISNAAFRAAQIQHVLLKAASEVIITSIAVSSSNAAYTNGSKDSKSTVCVLDTPSFSDRTPSEVVCHLFCDGYYYVQQCLWLQTKTLRSDISQCFSIDF